MKITWSATLRAKAISWVTRIIDHAVAGQALDDLQHLAGQLGVERRGDLVEQHQLGLHRQRAGDRDALLLAAGELLGIGLRLVGEAHLRQHRSASSRCSARGSFSTRRGASMMFSSAVRCGKRL